MKKVMLEEYHSNPTTGATTSATKWNINMTLYELFNSLDPYCHPNRDMVMHNGARLVDNYNHTTPIAKLFRISEECRGISMANQTPFTEAQLLQKSTILVELRKVYNGTT